jgi:hypothetical protein
MNLWAKTIGQLAMLSVALFFFSCEDENSIIGYPNPNKKFEVRTVEIPLGTSVLGMDSLITDNKSVPSYMSLVGKYNDPMLGTVRATSFLQIIPAFSARLPANAVYDSAVFQVRLNFYTYGLTTDHYERYTIHRIVGDSLNRLIQHSYYAHDYIDYFEEPMGEASVYLGVNEIKRQFGFSASQQDTVLLRSKLADDVGSQLMDLVQSSDHSTNAQRQKFIDTFKGIALVPSEESSTIMALNLNPNDNSNFSRLYLYYHTPSDTLVSNFVINLASFTNIVADRSATELAGALPDVDIDPASGLRYIQSGVPLATKIDLTNLYAFLDTTENIIVNEAALIIDEVESPAAFSAHSELRLKILNDNNTTRRNSLSSDSLALSKYNVVTDGRDYAVQADNYSAENPFAVLSYDSKEARIDGYLTLFVQSLFDNRNDEDGVNESRIKYLALFPNAPVATRTVNRTIFHKDKLKIRVTYTKPSQVNQE